MTVALIVALSVTVALAVATFFYAYMGAELPTRPVRAQSAPQDRAVEEELRRTRDELRRARQLVSLSETLGSGRGPDTRTTERRRARRRRRRRRRALR